MDVILPIAERDGARRARRASPVWPLSCSSTVPEWSLRWVARRHHLVMETAAPRDASNAASSRADLWFPPRRLSRRTRASPRATVDPARRNGCRQRQRAQRGRHLDDWNKQLVRPFPPSMPPDAIAHHRTGGAFSWIAAHRRRSLLTPARSASITPRPRAAISSCDPPARRSVRHDSPIGLCSPQDGSDHGAGLTALYTTWTGGAHTVRRIRLRPDEELFSCGRAPAGLPSGKSHPAARALSSHRRRYGRSHCRTSTIQIPVGVHLDETWRKRFETIEASDAYGNASFAHLVFPANHRSRTSLSPDWWQYRSRGFPAPAASAASIRFLPLSGRALLR